MLGRDSHAAQWQGSAHEEGQGEMEVIGHA